MDIVLEATTTCFITQMSTTDLDSILKLQTNIMSRKLIANVLKMAVMFRCCFCPNLFCMMGSVQYDRNSKNEYVLNRVAYVFISLWGNAMALKPRIVRAIKMYIRVYIAFTDMIFICI